ncbi:MAG: KHG/KDPG aldolase [Porticoccaceae bacterium UBA1117]|jgi:2-dehydro-3-deoxyphosphogluconate aldolase/(4S)-4-hydroxy-2-oxoglutarate aldolase|nr:bifunctional 4-hydroxy-2-oxoglutarate aldolase/2-dehydro-3-deoxy-phosphogluconate aldolase [Porticoccaceae bacterium]CAI8265507.1 MAG: KHG/KDPG aldolase [Porticoccaceae bacterium UBA1117]|tara:strand:- start:55 stop:675 length:621 start_codon:yes stop_codon:yes gene_type:complete
MNDLLLAHPIIPVVVIERVEDAIPLAQALIAGGMPIMEVTLRTDAAVAGIEAIVKHVPSAIVGSGTVCNPQQFALSEDIGCQFIVSPGSTDRLLKVAQASSVPFLPGVCSASELMRGLDYGFEHFKFFPAEASGGIRLLKALHGPFGQAKFCATGGIGLHNVLDYLALKNVLSVGGSWITETHLVREKRWSDIQILARAAVSLHGH